MPPFFPLWMIITHALNVLFLLLLARSGIEVLSAFPKLYRNDHCTPGREWLRFTKETYSADSAKPWSSEDEMVSWSPVIALPGRKNLGMGRHWHFLTIQFWILTGAVYVALVFATGYWRYLLPTRWSIFPEAVKAVGAYFGLHYPPLLPNEPFNAVQKLSYFAVIFLLAPFQIATGAAMSPSVLARFPWYGRLFGGKQGARSLHFLGLCAFGGFVVVHVAMVVIHGVPSEFAAIVLGSHDASNTLALAIGSAGLLVILVINVIVTWFSLRHRRATQRLLGLVVNPFERVISRVFRSRQQYSTKDISPYHRVNGYPPTSAEYDRLARNGFRDFRLPIGGMVETPALVSLDDLRRLGLERQITKHNCIQGWTATAQWGGVPLGRVLDRVRPTTEADTLVLYAFDDKGDTDSESDRWGFFYGTIPLALARTPETLLVFEMNGGPLPVEHGAPLRLRIETQLGFKMTKWIKAIELTRGYDHLGLGQGGWREDQQYYANAAGI
ncbi:molybdopterin-dependent oxidoreductase [Actinoallomurus soli]|uniref:molybdopterin-dependent oxidoreductase n=1 Tax=Actinoallomurus soli TaxID=2952535 RepID=UPI0020932E5A|nr:molybdopterin-dependent oxidoreductase [Actinoallomurus soli]MCO5973957.1 molybdopterin-dependent oxidoreductase [Actinoallomurus soli]